MAAGRRSWFAWFSALAVHEKVLVAFSLLLAAFLVADPLVLGAAQGMSPGLREVFKALTGLGRSNWILIPSGAGLIVLAWLRARETGFRRRIVYGYAAQLLVFLFAAVALSGLTASLTKNVLGRARPKLFESLGPLEFQPFTFDSDFASFPSGHATTAGALAAVLAVIWPRARIPLFVAGAWVAATRFLIGAHYISDAVAGFALGVVFVYFLRGRLARRRWLFAEDGGGSVHLRGRALVRKATRTVTGSAARLARLALASMKPAPEPRGQD